MAKLVVNRRQAMIGLGAACIAPAAAFASSGRLAELQKAQRVVVGLANQPPYSGMNPDGTLTGLAPTVTKIIMERLGVPKVEGIIATYGELIPGMEAGRWDFIGACLTIRAERCAAVLFTDPLSLDGDAIFFNEADVPSRPAQVADLAADGFRVGVRAGGVTVKIAIERGVSTANLMQFQDDAGMIDGFRAKRINVLLGTRTALSQLLEQRGLPAETVYPLPDSPPHGSAAAFRKNDPELHQAFQTELQKMKASGEYASISKQFGFDFPEGMINAGIEKYCSA